MTKMVNVNTQKKILGCHQPAVGLQEELERGVTIEEDEPDRERQLELVPENPENPPLLERLLATNVMLGDGSTKLTQRLGDARLKVAIVAT
jgi:hypothetical protein